MSSRPQNLLKRPNYTQQFISLLDDERNQVSSNQSDCIQKSKQIQRSDTCQVPAYILLKEKPNCAINCSNLLSLPNITNYQQKFNKYHQKKRIQHLQRLYQKQLNYGVTKSRLIQISDEEEQQQNQPKNNYTNKQNNQNYQNNNQSEIQQQHYQEDREISEIGSQEDIIVVTRKRKPILKRLRKLVHTSNRVKLQNKENSVRETKQCPICLTDLNKKSQKKKGLLGCNHLFCLKCILQASRFSNRCPYCRASFNEIICNKKRIQIQDSHLNQQFQDPNQQPCYVCLRNDDFEHLLECQFCQYAYCHTYCDPRLNGRDLPEEVWHCASCQELLKNRDQEEDEEDEAQQQQEQFQLIQYNLRQEIRQLQNRQQLRQQNNQINQENNQNDNQNNHQIHQVQSVNSEHSVHSIYSIHSTHSIHPIHSIHQNSLHLVQQIHQINQIQQSDCIIKQEKQQKMQLNQKQRLQIQLQQNQDAQQHVDDDSIQEISNINDSYDQIDL